MPIPLLAHGGSVIAAVYKDGRWQYTETGMDALAWTAVRHPEIPCRQLEGPKGAHDFERP